LAPLLLLGRWQVGRPPGFWTSDCLLVQERKGHPAASMHAISAVWVWLSPAGPGAVDRVTLLPMRRQVRPRRVNRTYSCASSGGTRIGTCTYVLRILRTPAPGPWHCLSVCRGAQLTRHCSWTTTLLQSHQATS
jgi:hypothetical protein